MKFVKRFLLCCCFSIGFSSLAQDILYEKIIDEFKANYSNGDISNFHDVARLLDVDGEMFDPLGYHNNTTLVREVAARQVRENTLFKGVNLDAILISKASFEDFLNANRSEIAYSSLIDTYLNAPLTSFWEEHQIIEKKEQAKTPPIFLNASETKNLGANRADFKNDVDFYGALLKETYGFEDLELIPKILHHLMLTKDPKALFYIASEPYRLRNKFNNRGYNKAYYDFMNAYTDVTVKVKNEKGVFTSSLKENDYYNVKSKNYLFYWVQHYIDYEWDEQRGLFVNTKEFGKKEPILNTYFSNLYSQDSKLARASFEKILKSDVSEVNQLLKSHRFRSYGSNKVNDTLPSFLDRRIKVLVVLEKFYKEIQLEYELSPKLISAVSQLKSTESYKEKIAIENSLIDTLTYAEISKLEYFISLENDNLGSRNSLNNSLSRVFDYYYSNKMDEVINSKRFLRSYLKKAIAFDNFGIIGSQNYYLTKFKNISKKQEELLFELLNEERDADIIRAVESILGLVKIQNEHVPKISYYVHLVNSKDPDSLKKGLSRLNQLLTKNYSRHEHFRFSNSNDFLSSKTLNLTVQEILEIDSLSHSSFTSETLFAYFNKNLTKKDSLTELDLNRLYGYKKYHKNVEKEFLYKIKKEVDIGFVHFNPFSLEYLRVLLPSANKVSVLEELFGYWDANADPKELLDICFDISKSKSDKADFFEYLINYSKFIEWLVAAPKYLSVDSEKEIMMLLQEKLKGYRHGSFDYKSYTEALFLFVHRNQSFKERFRHAAKMEDEKISKSLIIDAFIKTKKSDFTAVIEGVVELNHVMNNYNKSNIINDGLGVPLTSYDNEILATAIKDYQLKGRKNFFKDIVQEIYPYAFLNVDLNFKEVYKILAFDNVLGFIGGQGDDRNDGVKALIRYLEEEYQTDLGFQYNLRYIDNSTVTTLFKRCSAWITFLIEKGLVVYEPEYNSFSNEN